MQMIFWLFLDTAINADDLGPILLTKINLD